MESELDYVSPYSMRPYECCAGQVMHNSQAIEGYWIAKFVHEDERTGYPPNNYDGREPVCFISHCPEHEVLAIVDILNKDHELKYAKNKIESQLEKLNEIS